VIEVANSSRHSIMEQRRSCFLKFSFQKHSKSANTITTVQYVRRQSHLKWLQIWRVLPEGWERAVL
jgi:hypothetical protein